MEKNPKIEFKAEIINDRLVVKAIPERKKDGSLIMHVPSITLISKLSKEHGKRNIQ